MLTENTASISGIPWLAATIMRAIEFSDTTDQAVQTRRVLDGLDSDALHACATVNRDGLLSVQLLNTTKEAIQYKLQIAGQYADIAIPANSVQTVGVQL